MDPFRIFLTLGSISGALAIVLGAFGGHALRRRMAKETLQAYEISVRYHLIHALALLAIALFAGQMPDNRLWSAAGWAFFAGTVVFSGSLYLLTAFGRRWLGLLTPLGALALLTGWLLLGAAAWIVY